MDNTNGRTANVWGISNKTHNMKTNKEAVIDIIKNTAAAIELIHALIHQDLKRCNVCRNRNLLVRCSINHMFKSHIKVWREMERNETVGKIVKCFALLQRFKQLRSEITIQIVFWM
jgi:hypothetical protein